MSVASRWWEPWSEDAFFDPRPMTRNRDTAKRAAVVGRSFFAGASRLFRWRFQKRKERERVEENEERRYLFEQQWTILLFPLVVILIVVARDTRRSSDDVASDVRFLNAVVCRVQGSCRSGGRTSHVKVRNAEFGISFILSHDRIQFVNAFLMESCLKWPRGSKFCARWSDG